jgi:hypothetical protein
MCARRSGITISIVVTVLLSFSFASCSSNTRTGTTFCQRLQNELPGINAPMESQGDVRTMVSRYKRLLSVAPLSIEEDFRILTNLLEDASEVNPNDPESLQVVADAAYAANTSALQVAKWVYETCAVDLVTGMNVAPPRTAAPTTIAPDPEPADENIVPENNADVEPAP